MEGRERNMGLKRPRCPNLDPVLALENTAAELSLPVQKGDM